NITTDSRPAPLAIFLGKGDGTFFPRRLHTILDNLGQSNFAPKLVDLDQDGLLDLLSVALSNDYAIYSFTLNRNLGSKLDATLGYQLTIQKAANTNVRLERSTD